MTPVLCDRVQRLLISPVVCAALLFALRSAAIASIHPGDTLQVKVWNHPELSKQVTVDANGNLRIPLSGDVAVAGLSESAAARALAYALRPYVPYPAVSIETVQQGANIFVSGGPVGVLKYQPGETLQSAIADELASPSQSAQTFDQAGETLNRVNDASVALRERIDLRNVKLERDGKVLGPFDTVTMSADGDGGPVLQPGDTIAFVYKPVRVTVLGDVADPGLVYLASDQTLAEAIEQAGGVRPTAVANHVVLHRDGASLSLALGDPLFQEPAHSGDVVTVPEAPRVDVLGTVATPGLVSLKTDSSLLSAIYGAGGPTRTADLGDVQIVRGNHKTAYDVTLIARGDVAQNPQLQDGDTVIVPDGHHNDFSGFFGILGGIAAGLATRL